MYTIRANFIAACLVGWGVATLLWAPALAQAPPKAGSNTATQPVRTAPLAVVGFEPAASMDERDRWMATGIEETLGTRLRRVPGLVVMPTVRAHLARRELQEGGQPDVAWEDVLALLGADRQVRGTVAGQPRKCTLSVEIRPIGASTASEKADFGPAPLFEVIDQATTWLVERLTGRPLPEQSRALVMSPPGDSPTTLEYFAKAVLAARSDEGRDVAYYLDRVMQYDHIPLAAHLMMAQIELRLTPETRATAAARLRHVQELARRQHDPYAEIEAELTHATVLQASGSYASALKRLERVLTMAREIGDVYDEIGVLSAICDAHLRQEANPDPTLRGEALAAFRTEQLKQGAAALETALRRLQALGDLVALAPTTNKLALIYDRLDQPDRCLAMHELTLKTARRIGARQTEATALMFLGQWYKRQGQLDKARKTIEQCLKLADDESRPKVQIALADVLALQDDRTAAIAQYEAAYQALFDTDDLANQLLCLDRIATLREQLGERRKAIEALQDALDIAELLEAPAEKTLRERLEKLRRHP